ncbi:MAG TPA: POTRA domain-containing protein [Pyrinomonadaceae bacterium]|jgi:outer membrane protein insertion porin family
MHAIPKGLIFKSRRRTLAAMFLALALISAARASVWAQEGVLASAQTRTIAPLRSTDTPQGSHVTITSDLPLGDCSSYQYEGRFYVFIPQASVASAWDERVMGRAFTDARVERRGSAIVLSFGLIEGGSARLERKFNRIDIFFNAPRRARQTVGMIAPPAARSARRKNARHSAFSSGLLRRASFDTYGTADVGDYEGRLIADVEVVLEGSPRDATAEAEFLSLLRVAPNTEYSAVRVRESLQALFDSGRVSSARVEVSQTGAPGSSRPVRVRFVVRLQVRVGEVLLDLGVLPTGAPISEDELRTRLNMLEPGTPLTEQKLKQNADLIQAYLRDRGFYRAEVDFTQQTDASGTRAIVTFRIQPGEQARVAAFDIQIKGFDASRVRPSLRLQQGAPFTRPALGEDIGRIRQAIIALGYLAPQLDDPKVTLDPSGTQVTVGLTGGIGPAVTVTIHDYQLKEKSAREILPIKREGSIDYSVIIEGARRLRNRLQESGYFFAEVTAACTVTPIMPDMPANGTEEACKSLNPAELTGRTVNVTYNVERGRRFKLKDIRLEGTTKLTIEEIEPDLRTQRATVLGFIPLLGYGRGYTSRELLAEDQRTIRARMRDLGYRKAEVTVRQGVAIQGEGLIITFVVNEGPLTRIAGVEIRGNQIYTEARLRDELGEVAGGPFSRSEARAAGDRILNLYARNGYIDARLDFSTVDLPTKGEDEQVRLVYTITNEGDKVFINRILVNGNIRTHREAIVRSIPLVEGEVLRADKLAESERILYATDAFRQVIIRTERAGETAAGFKKRDVVIDVEELKPRILSYGGGYSTDNGPLGFVDIRNVNLFGKLRQGSFRIRASQRQQLMRLEYFDPRFQRYGEGQFAPLALSLQYQRDSTVTRFFRSTIDRGNFGIVQRFDEEGNPVDVFGNPAGEPTINRFTFNAETQRVIDRDTRSILFLRFNYEDVRLLNIESLLISEILRPDRKIRLARLGATFVRDTRDSQFDPTRGNYLNLDYSLALRQLGGNLSFNKFQSNYRHYYKLNRFRGTVLAGSVTLGLANLFNPQDRNDNGVIDDVDETLPISERFFSGGSTTLRGFGYEEAGPRVVAPQCFLLNPIPSTCGLFRNQKGEPVTLNPFLVPIGGNALAVLNLEARVPLSKAFGVVPFYDGGNVFRRVGDLFGRNSQPGEDPNLRAQWTHTLGLGFRIKTPLGGTLSVDYGFLLNPPEFLIPQAGGDQAVIRLHRGKLHFRFTQAF